MPDALSIAIVVTIINLGIVVFDIAQRAKIGKLIDDKRSTYSDWPDPSPERDNQGLDDKDIKQLTCDFCHGCYAQVLGKTWQELNGNKANLYFAPNNKTYVISRDDDKDYHPDDFEFAHSTPVNYCPFCGRDLVEEEDATNNHDY